MYAHYDEDEGKKKVRGKKKKREIKYLSPAMEPTELDVPRPFLTIYIHQAYRCVILTSYRCVILTSYRGVILTQV